MIDVLTSDGVRAAEQAAMDGGITETMLRINASLAVTDAVTERLKGKPAKIAVFCGHGGNGCDGLLAVYRLFRSGYAATAYLTSDICRYDDKTLALVKSSGATVTNASEYRGGADIVIDAIFGIGLNRNVDGSTATLIQKLNADKKAFRLAVDIPSGLNADTGEVMGVAFNAHVTLSFSCYKLGMLFGSGRDVCGSIVVENIGINTKSDIRVYGGEDFQPYARAKTAHKGASGRIFIVGGCGSMIGAPLMAGAAAHAAYLNGAGTVTVCLPKIHRAAAASRATMAMMKFLPDTPDGYIKFDKTVFDGILNRAVAIDLGIGMGDTPDLKEIVKYVCLNFDGRLVLDADALNAIAGDYSFLRDSKAKIALTPHVGEFERLTGKRATVENAVALAKESNCIVVLKSATTIVTDGKEVRLNIAGTPAMAKGGMGDLLGGCITALSCAYDLFDAASVACYRNGAGAERAVSSYAEMMLTARDVLKYSEYDEL